MWLWAIVQGSILDNSPWIGEYHIGWFGLGFTGIALVWAIVEHNWFVRN